MTNLVWNERIKLRASALNTLATTTCAVFILAPVAAFLYGSPGMTTKVLLAVAPVGLVSAIALHLAAGKVLTRLRE